MVDFHGRVFGEHLVEGVGETAFVAAARRTDGETEHRLREADRTHAHVAVFRIAVQNRTVAQFVDLRGGADVARGEHVGFGRVLALQNQRVSDLDGLLVVVDVEDGILRDLALMDAEDADLADVRVVDDLEDLRDDGRVLVGLRGEGFAVAANEERFIGFGRTRKVTDDDLHEVADADEVLGRHEAHRNDVAFAKGLRDERMERTRVDGALFEIAFELFVVFFHDAFDEGAVDVGDAHDVGFAFFTFEAVDDVRVVLRGKVDREDARTPDRLHFGEEFFEVGFGDVELVDDDHAAELAFGRHVHHALREEIHALGGVDHGRDGLDGVKRREVLADVVGVPRGVEHVNAHGGEVRHGRVDVGDRQADRVADFLFQGVVVAHRVPAFDRAGFGNHAAAVEHGFDEGGLAAGAVPYQG